MSEPTNCPECREEMYFDCMGGPRCQTCDPPCPWCDDGGIHPEDDEEDDWEEYE